MSDPVVSVREAGVLGTVPLSQPFPVLPPHLSEPRNSPPNSLTKSTSECVSVSPCDSSAAVTRTEVKTTLTTSGVVPQALHPELDLKAELVSDILRMGDEDRTVLYRRAIQSLLRGHDTSIQLYGGSAIPYIVPIIQRIDVKCAQTQAVVVNRYRESSIQYREEVRALGDKLSVTSHACVGGLPPAIDRKALGAGIQVVFGTPGRLQDLFEHVVWDISNVKILVLEFDDAKDVEVWHDQLTYLCAKLPKAQLCVVAENKEVIDKLSLLFRRELDNIDFMKR